MAAVVVDSDIVSFQFKRDTRAALYQPHLAGKQWILSFQTVAELDGWALQRAWGAARRTKLERHLGKFVIVFAERLLCSWWAEATNRARRNGRPINAADAWIAATALAMDVPLVTNNPADYAGVDGLTIISEVRVG
jgi:tRNA(fMet)-specific endonuclease VapC